MWQRKGSWVGQAAPQAIPLYPVPFWAAKHCGQKLLPTAGCWVLGTIPSCPTRRALDKGHFGYFCWAGVQCLSNVHRVFAGLYISSWCPTRPIPHASPNPLPMPGPLWITRGSNRYGRHPSTILASSSHRRAHLTGWSDAITHWHCSSWHPVADM